MRFSNKMFFIWDENHNIQTWMPYVNRFHIDEPFWHIFIDSILLDIYHELEELLTTMIDLNKYVFFPCVYFYYSSKIEYVIFLLISNVSFLLLLCMCVKFDHVKPSLVHKFFCIQGIEIIPLKQFKDVLPIDVCKKCESTSRKTWHSFTSKALFYYMYMVIVSCFFIEFHFIQILLLHICIKITKTFVLFAKWACICYRYDY
jgi:hypothetical protein